VLLSWLPEVHSVRLLRVYVVSSAAHRYFRGNARFNEEPENRRKSYEKPPPSFYSNETSAAKRAVQQPRHGFSTQGECASVIPAPDEKPKSTPD
jgi:hypothetical protein